jgi:mannitol/fructose-specific phosphotransferase system IIA component (Ntr-type)
MLCHYLTPSSILIETGVPEKEVLLNRLIDRLIEVYHLPDPEKVRQAVWDREKEGRTVLENGLAIPHARIGGIEEIKACLGIVPQGYKDLQENVLVHIVFLFLSPQKHFEIHLQMLAKISRVFQDAGFIGQLSATSSPEEAFQLLQRQERG